MAKLLEKKVSKVSLSKELKEKLNDAQFKACMREVKEEEDSGGSDACPSDDNLDIEEQASLMPIEIKASASPHKMSLRNVKSKNKESNTSVIAGLAPYSHRENNSQADSALSNTHHHKFNSTSNALNSVFKQHRHSQDLSVIQDSGSFYNPLQSFPNNKNF